ncbi:phage tail protein [Alkalicoccobacillus plakortidis]|uniref:Phage-related protein n=1 Tax=Alkalicoccobacillus plakortidis TaxID=444060 RepID=A0ABT0XI61_9BACI|nr:hypothetical protein [Alkalicoccobacillus plakortidis]MCM2675574.1 hypothetical protein [Alkalicoccobacillus plakortidis]
MRLGPVLTVLGTFIIIIGKVMSAMAPVMHAIAAKGGLLNVLRLGFMALTGPIGITIAVITALTTGFIIAYKKSETFRNIIHAVRDAFVNAYQKVKEFLTTNPQFLAFIDSVKKGFADAKRIIMDAIGVAMDFVRQKIAEIKKFWDSEGQAILKAFQNIFSGIWKVTKPIIDGLVAAFKWAFPYMQQIFSVAFKIVLEVAKMIWGNIKGVIDGGLKFIMGLAKTFSSLFTGDFRKMWEGIKQMFSGAIQFVWNFIQLMFFGRILKAWTHFYKKFRRVHFNNVVRNSNDL